MGAGAYAELVVENIKAAMIPQGGAGCGAGVEKGRSGGLGDDGTDEAGLRGAQPLYLHEEDGLIFAPVKFGDVPGPLVESILPFQLEDYDGPRRNPLRKIRMFHNVTIKLEPEDGIQPFKFRHGQSPRRNR